MNGAVFAGLGFVLMLGSAAAGATMRARTPATLQNPEARDVVRHGTSLIAVLAAVLIGMGIVSMKATFDAADRDVRRLASQIEELDRTLRRLGAPAEPSRDLLFRFTVALLRENWPRLDPGLHSDRRPAGVLQDELEEQLETLSAGNNVRRPVTQAQSVLHAVVQTRWSMRTHDGRLIENWQLGMLVIWLMLAFTGFGMFAPRNRVMLLVLVASGAAAASALFLLREFDDPFIGILTVSGEPLLAALHALADG
jgi:hypothetical protein